VIWVKSLKKLKALKKQYVMKLESLVYLIFSNPFMLFMSFMVKKKNAQDALHVLHGEKKECSSSSMPYQESNESDSFTGIVPKCNT